jgi:protein SCO1
MNGACYRSSDTQRIPINFQSHRNGKNIKRQQCCKIIKFKRCKKNSKADDSTFVIRKMSMSKKGIFYTGFFLCLTIVFYFAVKKYFVPNNTISIVQPFSFVNQDGVPVTNQDVEGKVYVAEYFFTTCKGICPIMNNNMEKVYEKFKNENDFLILSHTCDPENDSVEQLKKYADSLGVDTKRWVFLTGRKDSLYRMARISYTIDDPSNNLKDINDDFLHTQFWALVNKKGQVKKIYDGLKETEISAMIKDIRKLLKE